MLTSWVKSYPNFMMKKISPKGMINGTELEKIKIIENTAVI